MPRKSFFIFCLTFFTVSFGVSAMAALIPSVAAYFGQEQDYVLKLTWLYMLPYGFFALVWSPLTRVIKIKNILLFTTLGFCFSTFMFSFSQSVGQAFFFRFLMGCFGCSFVPLVLISVAKTVPKKSKSKYIGVLFSVSYVSTFLSVFLSGFLHWKVIYLIPAFLSFLIFIFVLFFLESFDFRKEKFKISYRQTFADREALTFFLVIMAGSFLYHSLQQRLGVYLNKTYDLQQVVISSIFTMATLSAIFFEFTGGFLGSHLGNVKIARAGFILMSVFAILLLFTGNYRLLFLFIIIWGGGWSLTHVGLSSHLAHFPDKILRDASSLNSALRFSMGGLGAVAGGFLVNWLGFRFLFVFVGLGVFFLGLYLNRILQVTKECHGKA